MKALLIIDMQRGCFTPETPRYNAKRVVQHINELAVLFRQLNFPVFVIRHDGLNTGVFKKYSDEWKCLDSLILDQDDCAIDKYANDAFYKSDLREHLAKYDCRELVITGCATDFCVESTVQSALAKDYQITVVADAHTTADRPHLKADKVIEHYNWLWQNMIPTKGWIEVKTCDEVMESLLSEVAN